MSNNPNKKKKTVKIELISSIYPDVFKAALNAFIENKTIRDIKFNSFALSNSHRDNIPTAYDTNYQALVIYEEEKKNDD